MGCTFKAMRDASSPHRINLIQPADLAMLRRVARGWDICEVLTLNIEPLEFVDSEEYDDDNQSGVQLRDYGEALNAQTVQQLGQLQQLGLCLALQEADHDERDPEGWDAHKAKTVIGLPWVQALLTSPCALRLLSLEIYYAPTLPHFQGLQHLLLFVRRRVGQPACAAIGRLHALQTLCVTGAQYVLDEGEDRFSLAMPALDLRSCRRLRAAAFFDAVPEQLQLPDGCRCSVEADSVTLDRWWAKDSQRCHDAVTVYADEHSDNSSSLSAWLRTPCACLTILEITCETLSASSIDLPGLRELYIDALRYMDISFRSPLRLTALSLVTNALLRFDFDSPGDLVQHLSWFHLNTQQDCGGAAFLQPLQDACKARGLPRWHMEENQYEKYEYSVEHCTDVEKEYRAVLAYFPVGDAATPGDRLRGRCWCGGACHKCLKAAGIMHAQVCMPAMPIMLVESPEW